MWLWVSPSPVCVPARLCTAAGGCSVCYVLGLIDHHIAAAAARRQPEHTSVYVATAVQLERRRLEWHPHWPSHLGPTSCRQQQHHAAFVRVAVSAAEAATAVAPSAVPTVTLGEQEAARVVAADAVVAVASSAAGGVMTERWEAELPLTASTSSSTGVGSRRRVGSLMGCAGRGKGTAVGDGGDGLARSQGWRFSVCHLRMVNTGG